MLGLVVGLLYAVTPVSTQYDSRFVLQTADSFLRGRGGALDAYEPALRAHDWYITERIGGQVRSMFPIGTALLAMPFVAATEAVNPRFAEALVENVQGRADKLIGVFYSAVAVALFAWLLWRRFADARLAIAGALAFAFTTSMWSTASRGLWQHGPVAMLFIVAMLLLFEGRRRPALVPWAALPIAFAFVTRPGAAVEVAVFTLYVLLVHPRRFMPFLLLAATVAVPWLWYNWSVYGAIVAPYYGANRLNAGGAAFWTGFFGQLVSPGRGLFVYSPITLLAIPGAALALRRPDFRDLHLAFLAVIALQILLVARFPDWYGGHSYGPRYMIDVLPFLMYFGAFAVKWACDRQARLASAAVLLLAAASVFMHASGALTFKGYAWNGMPTDVNADQARLWDWGDPPFLRTAQAVLELLR